MTHDYHLACVERHTTRTFSLFASISVSTRACHSAYSMRLIARKLGSTPRQRVFFSGHSNFESRATQPPSRQRHLPGAGVPPLISTRQRSLTVATSSAAYVLTPSGCTWACPDHILGIEMCTQNSLLGDIGQSTRCRRILHQIK